MASVKTEYKTEALDWTEEDKLMLLECWMRDGYRFQDIADKIGITRQCLDGWRNKYPEIDEALKKGKEVIDYKVENALLKAALGYKTKETKVTVETLAMNQGIVSTTREVTEKDVAPNVVACQVWLYNRKPESWKRNRDKIIEIGDEESTIQVSVIRAGKKEEKDEDVVNESIEIKPKDSESSENKEDLDYWPEDWEDGEDDE